jgi:hypothetical protein
MKRIILRLVTALVMVALAANVALAAPPVGKGQPGAAEDKVQGSPYDPNAWGSVASQLGAEGVMGEHSSDPVPLPCCEGNETPRDGLGNVARNDAREHGTSGSCSDPRSDPDNCDTGDHLADHACIAAAAPLPGIVDEDGNPIQPDCAAEPGHSP